MTIDTQQHRACIGLFHFVFNAFMYYRAKKSAACFYRTLKLPLSARPSDLVLLFLTASLLLRAGDVEPNPGPNTEMDRLSYQNTDNFEYCEPATCRDAASDVGPPLRFVS